MVHAIVVTQFTKMLTNLLAILGETEKFAGEKNSIRRAVAVAPLTRPVSSLMQQIRTACDTAKLGAARLAGREKDAPVHADTEQTLARSRRASESVIAYLRGFSPDAFAAAAERRSPSRAGTAKTLSGRIPDPARHAHFYFHVARLTRSCVTTASASARGTTWATCLPRGGVTRDKVATPA